MIFEDKVNEVIGKPYDAYKAHCWDLVMHLCPDAPRAKGVAHNLTCSVRQFSTEMKKYNLNKIELSDIKDKDIVFLGRNNIMFHAGVYYNGGVVHASERGVVYESMSTIKVMYTNIKGIRV